MLVVIHIGTVLKSPVAAVYSHGNDPVILARGVIYPAGIPFVFPAKKALGIPRLLCQFCCGDGLWILFGLGEINGDIKIPVLRFSDPLHILLYPVTANVIRITA